MKNSKIKNLTLQNNRGQSVLYSDLYKWRSNTGQFEIFGPIESYTWEVDGIILKSSKDIENITWNPLPDGDGFICFEKGWNPDNCLLLDAYGKEKIRLAVPWQLTRQSNPEPAKPPTSFTGVSSPYINPADGKVGQFGVTAWVEYAGMYYFELDYKTGRFLWGKEIRD